MAPTLPQYVFVLSGVVASIVVGQGRARAAAEGRDAVGAQRDGSDDRTMASLAYDGRYYGLYVEVTDMVISAE